MRKKRSTDLRFYVYGLILTLFAGVGAAAIWNAQPLQSANDRSRWVTIRALVETGEYPIDAYLDTEWDSIDKVRVQEGEQYRFYSSKPPLLATMVAGVVKCVTTVSGWLDADGKEWTLADDPVVVTRITLIIVNLLPMLIALVVLIRLLERCAQSKVTRMFVVAAAAFGTFLTTYLVTLNNHIPAAYSVMFAIAAAYRILAEDSKNIWHFFVAGLFAAFACTNELPAAALGLALFFLLVFKRPKQTILVFGPAALIPLGAFFWTNYIVTGGWKPFYAFYGTEVYNFVHRGVPSYWMNPTGIDAGGDSTATYLFHCTLGHHGVLSLSPVFCLTVLSWLFFLFRQRAGNSLHIVGLILTLAVLGFYLTRTANYNYGGNTAGLRWMFWLIPFWLLAMVPIFDAARGSRVFRWFATLLLVMSAFSAVEAWPNPWKPSWLYRAMEARGWVVYAETVPKPLEGNRHTWFGELAEPGEWVELAGVDLEGREMVLRLESLKRERRGGRNVLTVRSTLSRGGRIEETLEFAIDEQKFRNNAPVEEYLVDSSSYAQQKFLWGLPGPSEYTGGRFVYERYTIRDDAFRIRTARAQVGVVDPPKRVVLSRVVRTSEVPFGVSEKAVRVATRAGQRSDVVLILRAVSRFQKRRD